LEIIDRNQLRLPLTTLLDFFIFCHKSSKVSNENLLIYSALCLCVFVAQKMNSRVALNTFFLYSFMQV